MNIWLKLGISVNDWDNLVRYKFIENTSKDGVFCDVGACNGIFTNLFKDISGKNGKVYSFELNPLNYNNISWLKDKNCIIENLAIAGTSGEVEYFSDSNTASDFTSNIVGCDTAYRQMNKIGKVKSITLDEYFKDINVDYLKIDVEGAEYDVIKGGLETIKKCKYVIIECHFQNDWEKIFNLLKEHNLNFKNLTDDVDIFYRDTEVLPGIAKNGMPYQIYLKNE
jgi:FkbM family methyltransferase